MTDGWDSSFMLHIQDVMNDFTGSKIKSIINIAITWSLSSHSMEANIVIMCGSWHIFLADSSFDFRFKDRQKSKIDTVLGNFQNPSFAHHSLKLTSDMKTRWQIMWNETVQLTSSIMLHCHSENSQILAQDKLLASRGICSHCSWVCRHLSGIHDTVQYIWNPSEIVPM